jgi:hypothetical protein
MATSQLSVVDENATYYGFPFARSDGFITPDSTSLVPCDSGRVHHISESFLSLLLASYVVVSSRARFWSGGFPRITHGTVDVQRMVVLVAHKNMVCPFARTSTWMMDDG